MLLAPIYCTSLKVLESKWGSVALCNCAGWCWLPQKLGNSPWRAIVLACEAQICKSHSFASFVAGVSNEYKVLLTCPGAAMRQGTDFCLWTSGTSWQLGPLFDSFPCMDCSFRDTNPARCRHSCRCRPECNSASEMDVARWMVCRFWFHPFEMQRVVCLVLCMLCSSPFWNVCAFFEVPRRVKWDASYELRGA